MLSPQTKEGPEIGTPIIGSLYRIPGNVSTPCFIATNSALKTEVSIVGCCLDIHVITAELRNVKNPVRERLVGLSPTHRQAFGGQPLFLKAPVYLLGLIP